MTVDLRRILGRPQAFTPVHHVANCPRPKIPQAETKQKTVVQEAEGRNRTRLCESVSASVSEYLISH